ncbi:Clan CA, family C19, ubiquitin hydrolase-like cysteine peptidase [Trichomonas vaginalis G3]|uniref:Clan CA, family C19, ubiquitin hydrolase-like cysteine peptidase n=1 Tax=Trichomonas vaginalis (strain ATCC PRA-98 / G3) TaxID=412133 RepID=A2F9R5_TRIV3|nr:ubiquitinyl hydrolase protein [Trichomonas vaginalis G3]EAX98357.1 Clan CA, family C19, ubiquitin hydrolase-like cysteine peptidase [Trichomonas vaginalis G3]KAI5495221.1 ubiquitinyl hydrolase protein [Trichomonas vaginalis G3]|eukprot:XP_001311287.1 Clan CA, family C19, ubiquitin hydrolase-like cysteine peptidase [Trichomonas vaginalis G3]
MGKKRFIPSPKEDLIKWSEYFYECIIDNKNIKNLCHDCEQLVNVLFASDFITKESITMFFNNNLPAIIEALVQKYNVSNKNYESIFRSFLDLYYQMLIGEYSTQSKHILLILDPLTTCNSKNQESYQANVQYFIDNVFLSVISYAFEDVGPKINSVYSSIFTLLKNITIFITKEQNDLVFNLCISFIDDLYNFDEDCVLDFINFAKYPNYHEILHMFANKLYECVHDNEFEAYDYINSFIELIDFGIDFTDTPFWEEVCESKYRKKFREKMIPYLMKISNKFDNEKLSKLFSKFDDRTRDQMITNMMNKLGTSNSEEMANKIKFIFQINENPENIPWKSISMSYKSNPKAFDSEVCKLLLSKIESIKKPYETDAILIISQLISNVACDLEKRKQIAEEFHQFKIISENIMLSDEEIESLLASYRITYDKQTIITELMNDFIKYENSFKIREKILRIIPQIISDGNKYGESSSKELEGDKSSLYVNVQSDFGFNELEINKNWKINELYSYFSILEGLPVNEFTLFYDNQLIKEQQKVSDLKIDENKYLLIKYNKINTIPKIPVTARLEKRSDLITKIVSIPSSATINDLIQILKVTFKINGIYGFKLNDKNIKTKKTIQELSMNKNDVICISKISDDEEESYLTIKFVKEIIKSNNFDVLRISPPPKELIEQMNDMPTFVQTLKDENDVNYIDYVLNLIKEKNFLQNFLENGGYNQIVDFIIDGLDITNNMIQCVDNQFDVSYNLKEFAESLFSETKEQNLENSEKILEILFNKSRNNQETLLPDQDLLLQYLEKINEKARNNLLLIISKIPNEFDVLLKYYRENPNVFAKYFEIFMSNDDTSIDDLIFYMKSENSNKEKVLEILEKRKSVKNRKKSDNIIDKKYYDDIYSVFSYVRDIYQLKILNLISDYKLNPENLQKLVENIGNLEYKKWNNHGNIEESQTLCQYVVGIINPGSICYVNSSLQQLFYCKPFRNFILNNDFGNSEQNNELKNVFNMLQAKTEQMISLDLFCNVCNVFPGSKLSDQQQDAQEFLTLLIGNIKNADKNFNFKNVTSFINKSTGTEVNQRVEDNLMLDLTVIGYRNFEQSMNSVFNQEEISGYNYHNQKITAIQKKSIKDLSNNLIIHLKRFEFTETGEIRKIKSKFEFPFEFNSNVLDKNSNLNYKLHGVICHQGEALFGHYISIIRTKDLGFVRLDDGAISLINEREFRETTLGGVDDYETFTAYILFYSVDDLIEIKSEKVQEIKQNNDVFLTKEFYNFVMNQNDPYLALSYCLKCYIRTRDEDKHCDDIYDLIMKGEKSEICERIKDFSRELVAAIKSSTNRRIVNLSMDLLKYGLKSEEKSERKSIFNKIYKEIDSKSPKFVNSYCDLILNYLKEHLDDINDRGTKHNKFIEIKNDLKHQKDFDLSILDELCEITFEINSEKMADEFITSVINSKDYKQLYDTKTDIIIKFFGVMCFDLLFDSNLIDVGKQLLSKLIEEKASETINLFFDELFQQQKRLIFKGYKGQKEDERNCFLTDYLSIFIKSFENSKDLRSQLTFQRFLRLCHIYHEKYCSPPATTFRQAKIAQLLIEILLLFEPKYWVENEINFDDGDEGLVTLKIEPVEMTNTILSYIIKLDNFVFDVFPCVIKAVLKGNEKLISILTENDRKIKIIVKSNNKTIISLLNDLFVQKFDNEEISEIMIPFIPVFYAVDQKLSIFDHFLDHGSLQQKEDLLICMAQRCRNDSIFQKIFPYIEEILKDKNISFINYFVDYGLKYQETFIGYSEAFNRIKEELETNTNINYDELLLNLLKVYIKKFENEKEFFKIGEIFLIVLKKNYFDEKVEYKQTAEFMEKNKKSRMVVFLLSSLYPLMNRSFENIRYQEVEDKGELVELICDLLANKDECGDNLDDMALDDELISILFICELVKENPEYKQSFSLKPEQLSEKTRSNQTVIDTLFTE